MAITEDFNAALTSEKPLERLRRAVVTENVGDFERARVAFERTGRSHHGVIYARAPQFNRNLGAGVIGPMMRALDRLLRGHPEHDPQNRVIYLRRAE